METISSMQALLIAIIKSGEIDSIITIIKEISEDHIRRLPPKFVLRLSATDSDTCDHNPEGSKGF